MKRLTKIILGFAFLGTLVWVIYLIPIQKHGSWEIDYPDKELAWVPFLWSNDSLGGQFFEKTAMMIPCSIEGIENPVTLQFDLGAWPTGLYENCLTSITNNDKKLTIKNHRYKFLLPKDTKYLKDFALTFGSYKLFNKKAGVYQDYGSSRKRNNNKDTVHNLGTIGADIFQNRVLVIDYPNQRFAIYEDLPKEYSNMNFVDIEIDEYGTPILPMKIKGKNYVVAFDNGASIFELWTLQKNIAKFTTSEDIDTLTIKSWGVKHDVTSKIISDTVELAGSKFVNVKIYANHTGFGVGAETDATTGNALFWDRLVVIDFRNKKFGLK